MDKQKEIEDQEQIAAHALKFKVRFMIEYAKSPKKMIHIYRSFTWADKEDALAFQALLKKAEDRSKHIYTEFVEFVPERPF